MAAMPEVGALAPAPGDMPCLMATSSDACMAVQDCASFGYELSTGGIDGFGDAFASCMVALVNGIAAATARSAMLWKAQFRQQHPCCQQQVSDQLRRLALVVDLPCAEPPVLKPMV